MIKQSLPSVSTLTKDTLEDFKKADKVVLVAYLDAADKASADKAINDASYRATDAKVSHTPDRSHRG